MAGLVKMLLKADQQLIVPKFGKPLVNHILQNILCPDGAADIAVANEKYSRHIKYPSSDAAKRRVLRSFAGFLLLFQMYIMRRKFR